MIVEKIATFCIPDGNHSPTGSRSVRYQSNILLALPNHFGRRDILFVTNKTNL